MTDKNLVELGVYDVIRRPIVTEKSQIGLEKDKYYFQVDLGASKHDIKKAIEHVFGKEVVSVNTIVRKGKNRTFKGRKATLSDKKIAIVTLKPGQVIELGAGE